MVGRPSFPRRESEASCFIMLCYVTIIIPYCCPFLSSIRVQSVIPISWLLRLRLGVSRYLQLCFADIWSCWFHVSAVQWKLQADPLHLQANSTGPAAAAAILHHARKPPDSFKTEPAQWAYLARGGTAGFHQPNYVWGWLPYVVWQEQGISDYSWQRSCWDMYAEGQARLFDFWQSTSSTGCRHAHQTVHACTAGKGSLNRETATWWAPSQNVHIWSDSAQDGGIWQHALGWERESTDTCVHALGITGQHTASSLLEPLLYTEVEKLHTWAVVGIWIWEKANIYNADWLWRHRKISKQLKLWLWQYQKPHNLI